MGFNIRILAFIATIVSFAGIPAFAQDSDPEKSKLEVTGSYWRIDTSGTIQANGTPINFKSDLGVIQGTATFAGKLVAKPGRKQKIVVEGTPFRVDGLQNLTRSISYRGQTYSINDRVVSNASLDYIYAGYQYDFVSKPGGHAGIGVGGAYLNATGTITSTTANVTQSKSETVGLPLAGAEFRVFPVHKKVLVELNGEVKGMAFGSYGHFVQATGSVGAGFGPLLFEAGYRVTDIDIHTTDGSTAVTPRFTGPVFSVVFRIP